MYNELSKLLCNQVQIFFEIPDSSFQIPVSSFRFQLLVVPVFSHTHADVPGPTLLQLLDELEKLDNWFMFGTRLGVPVNQLRKIESSHQLSIDRCKVDMLQYCLDNRVDISWVKIAETLEKTDQLALAAKIRQKYLSIDGKGKVR